MICLRRISEEKNYSTHGLTGTPTANMDHSCTCITLSLQLQSAHPHGIVLMHFGMIDLFSEGKTIENMNRKLSTIRQRTVKENRIDAALFVKYK